jgi:hypothetical protein
MRKSGRYEAPEQWDFRGSTLWGCERGGCCQEVEPVAFKAETKVCHSAEVKARWPSSGCLESRNPCSPETK